MAKLLRVINFTLLSCAFFFLALLWLCDVQLRKFHIFSIQNLFGSDQKISTTKHTGSTTIGPSLSKTENITPSWNGYELSMRCHGDIFIALEMTLYSAFVYFCTSSPALLFYFTTAVCVIVVKLGGKQGLPILSSRIKHFVFLSNSPNQHNAPKEIFHEKRVKRYLKRKCNLFQE